ncbi:hyperosmotically inducible protein [Maridesulfovibrio ferrireducens]|uniref:Hyperosmotically inducible protein n=1 Tax=Maridesulfovibrio ferrireducens TaxID=246191 RepID=A0A1G9FJ72_9BACT|nr:BON domain-containing protein [Maridesulfovibrio ferrireducens]SDK88392.1 hyperosmotically inducible protein [Maridesulfovibrio ferrireducens]
MQKIKLLCLMILSIACINGCAASIFIPPLPGPTMIPSALGSIYTAYAIGADERGFQTIIEDELLEANIQSQILHQKDLEVLGISTYSYNGHVYVVGKYDEKEDFNHIRKIVKKSGKVNSLTTFLFAEKEDAACNAADDYMLQMQVKGALLNDESVWGTNIAVKSVQCNIILLGRVGNINEVARARQTASQIAGVVSIKSFIKSSKHNRYNIHTKREVALNK